MADEAKFTITVLWAEELRLAAGCLKNISNFVASKKGRTLTDDEKREYSRLTQEAVEVCFAALYDIAPDTHIVVCEGKYGKRRSTKPDAGRQEQTR